MGNSRSAYVDGIPSSIVAIVVTIAAILSALAAYELRSGSPTAGITAIVVALLPVLAITAWRSPLIFPYMLYVMLIPFDLLLTLPTFGTAARLVGLISGIALIFYVIRTRSIVLPGWGLLAWAAFAAWSAASLLWTLDNANGAREAGTLAQQVALYAIVSIAPICFRDLRLLFGAVAAGGIIAALFGIHQLQHLSAAQQIITQVSDRIPLLVGDQKLDINEFADSLLLPLAILVVSGVRTRNLLLKVAAFGAVGLLLYAMSLAASREAFIACAVMMLYFAVVMRERLQVLAFIAISVVLAGANQGLLQRFFIASETGGSGRLSIWGAGLAAFREHWLYGAGAGGFSSAYNAIYLDIFQPYDMGWSRAAHNMLVQNSVEYGLVGLALLVIAIVLQFRSMPRVPQEDPLFAMRTGLLGGLLALCVAGFFVDLTTGKMLWLTFALIAQTRGVIISRREVIPEAR